MKTQTLIKQHDQRDCGAACLASVAAYYGLLLPIARIREYASTDLRGTNIKGLLEGAEKMGFSAKGVKGKIESLSKIPKPAIAHIIQNNLHHFVVIYKASPTKISVMDPADGKMHHYKTEEFGKIWSGALVLLVPSEKFEAKNQKKSVTARFFSLLRPHSSVLLEALVGAAVYTLLGLATSVYVQKIVDYVLPEQNGNLANLLSVVMLVLLLLQIYLGTVKSIFMLKTGQKIDAVLILGYYHHLLRLPQRFFDTMRTGEILSRVNDAVKIRVFLNDVAISLAVNLMVLVFSLALMFTYYWKLALVMLLIVPCYVLIYAIMNRWNRQYQRQLMVKAAELESQLVESIGAISTTKAFALQDFTFLKTENRFVGLLESVYQSSFRNILGGSTTEILSKLFTIILLWTGSHWVIERELTAGELLSFYTLIGYFTGSANSLIGFNKTLQDALIAAERLFEILDLEHEKDEGKIQLSPDLLGDISFRNVSFRYGSRKMVFENLHLVFPYQKISVVLGQSGSGKSTLMALLQNIYTDYTGNILIGNCDVKYIQNQSLRQKISVVPQQIELLAGTILENIAIGDFEPDFGRIIKLCQQVGILEFIEQLPAGFQTFLGEHGVGLSGGQKQRLAIVRALYRNPDILLLDEATSALDTDSEKMIENVLKTLKNEGKTIILITHRLNLTSLADHLIVLENGKIVEKNLMLV